MKKMRSKILLIGLVSLFLNLKCQVKIESENSQLEISVPSDYLIKKHQANNSNNKLNTSKTTSGFVQGRFDPSFSLPTSRGKTIGYEATDNIKLYSGPIFADSIARYSITTIGHYFSLHKVGVVFDPTSVIFDPLLSNPIFSPNDSYNLDTVWLGGIYNRIVSVTDTLNIEIVWGDTTNTAVFNNYTDPVFPFINFGSFLSPNYTSNTLQQGDRIRLNAPSTNKITIKKLLTDADTALLKNNNRYLPIPINMTLGQVIPAGNKVACMYSFVSGSTYSVGEISCYSKSGLPASINGFGELHYGQNFPVISTSADIDNGFDDFGTGKNFSFSGGTKQRYNLDTSVFVTNLRHTNRVGYCIDFSIHGNSTLGLNDLNESFGFQLGQNTPNPFTENATVTYKLLKDAKVALFTITDVFGKVISNQMVEKSIGNHVININSLSAGIYFYSLTIDGNVITKKMVIN